MRNISAALVLLCGILAFGAGCSWFNKNVANHLPDMLPAGPKPANFDNVSSADAAKRINFVVGSQIEMRQLVPGATSTAAVQDSSNKEGVRIITIERFAPMVYAQLNWKLGQKYETQASKDARAAYERLPEKKKPAQAPKQVMEMQNVIGSLQSISLKDSHRLWSPAYWPPEPVNSDFSSAIWVSQPVYEELTKTHGSTVYYGYLDNALYGNMKMAKPFAEAIQRLQFEVTKIQDRTDPDQTVSETELADWPLMVNGKTVTVQVIKARNWYGEIVVLNNQQNPLILKMTFDPKQDGISKTVSPDGFLQTLLGYEVTALNGVQ